ncbi:MAG: hypothetical protein MJ123_09945 [Lachnospiraceae bacterium]|nr:hypothetical protein [Lachnospiraceae bacterium]
MDNDKSAKEKLIKDLYHSLTAPSLPNGADAKNYYFDEGTGTWYVLTGKRRIDRPSIELAKHYFEEVLQPLKTTSPGTEAYQKALYCAIAIEAIDFFMKNKNKEE